MVAVDLDDPRILLALKREKARRSFVYFLSQCHIRSDDPLNPGLIPLEPWPYQVERAESWQAGTSEVILKERQLGFSKVLVDPYMLWRAMYYGWTFGYLSKGEAEAQEEILVAKGIYDTLHDWLRVKGTIRSQDASFEGGGRIIAFPATASAGISYTLQGMVMDESAFHPFAAQNYGAIQPAVSRGQVILLSTADPELGPSGFFHDMYWDSKRGLTPYKAVFVARVRPDRDAAFYERTRRAYASDPERFNAYYPETDAEAFTGKSGLVFPMFSEAVHVKAVGDMLRSGSVIVPLEQCVRQVAGIDLGGGDPTVVSILGMDSSHHVHKYAELYRRGPVPVDALAEFLVQYPGVGSIECPPEQATVIATLSNPRTYNLPAHAANNKRGDGLNLYATVLTNEQFTIDPSCKDSIAEFPGYRWAERTDPNDKTRYQTKTPVDHHADGKDSERYALMEILAVMHSPGSQMPRRSLSGRPLSRVLR